VKQRVLLAVAIGGSVVAALLFGGGPWPPF
jgi:hypothetical protein